MENFLRRFETGVGSRWIDQRVEKIRPWNLR